MFLLLATIFFISFLFLFFFLDGGRGKKTNLPPSPPKFPIIGNLHQIGTLPHRSFELLSQKYGPVMLLHMGRIPTLVVSSVEAAKEILKTHDAVFASRPTLTSSKQLLYNGRDMAFAPYGEYWRQVRKICMLELLSVKRVKSFEFVREEEVSAMLAEISQAGSTSEVVDLGKLLMSLSNNIVSRVALGKKYGEGDGKGELLVILRELAVLMGAFSVGDFFPSFAWLDVLTGLDAKLKRVAGVIDAFLGQVIEDHRARKMDGGDGTEHGDLVDVLLHLQKDSNLDIQLTDDNIKGIVLDLFSGGTETTSTTVEWAMSELMKTPNAMEKAQEEVRRVVGKKPRVEVEDLQQMDYLKCIIKETLRLHPPAPLLVPRESTQSATVQGYHIPPRTRVFVNVWAIARDPKLWKNADEFIPDRFINNPIDFKGQDFEYLPFGAGRRGCPGMAFALPVLELSLANLLYWFNWKLPDGVSREELDMSESSRLAVHKKASLQLVPLQYHFS